MRESREQKAKRLRAILDRLEGHPALDRAPIWDLKAQKKTPFRALVATLLSSRTRDETTASVVTRLFQEVTTPRDLLRYDEHTLAKKICPVGFYRVKARMLRKLAQELLDRFGGEVPRDAKALMSLPGVGRKTAHIVLAEVWGDPVIGVDVHVHRIAHRLGLVRTRKPEETEKALELLTRPEDRPRVNRILVALGQTICLPRNPRCSICPVRDLCPYGKQTNHHTDPTP